MSLELDIARGVPLAGYPQQLLPGAFGHHDDRVAPALQALAQVRKKPSMVNGTSGIRQKLTSLRASEA